jgi:ribose transport system ATP-binding protein
LVVAEGKVLLNTPATEIDEHGVLDLVMTGMAA